MHVETVIDDTGRLLDFEPEGPGVRVLIEPTDGEAAAESVEWTTLDLDHPLCPVDGRHRAAVFDVRVAISEEPPELKNEVIDTQAAYATEFRTAVREKIGGFSLSATIAGHEHAIHCILTPAAFEEWRDRLRAASHLVVELEYCGGLYGTDGATASELESARSSFLEYLRRWEDRHDAEYDPARTYFGE